MSEEIKVQPKHPISPFSCSADLFNALMAHYGNTARAMPEDSITKTLQIACANVGLFDTPTETTRIIQA